MNWPPIINLVAALVLAALLPKAEHPIAVLLGWVGIGCAIVISYMLGYIDAAKGESNGTVRAERSGFDTLPDDYKTGDY